MQGEAAGAVAGAEELDYEIVVVGAGFSGIGTAIKLREAGFEDFVVLEYGDGVGGAWHWNTYPGVAVDIPSFSYQFSFEPRSSWSRTYAPGEELKDYAEHCVRKYGVGDHFCFGVRIVRADFEADGDLWRLETSAGEEIATRFVINASGPLTEPNLPDIEGVESFEGPTLHTARWDCDLALSGKRIGVIGTGASAVQVIPEIAPEVAELVVFQRTPIWCLPRADAPLPGIVRGALGRFPAVGLLARGLSEAFVEVTFPLAAHFHNLLPLASGAETVGKAFLRQQVKDPETREKLTPSYAVGCKRPSFHNSYLSTFNRENVELETTPIGRITPSGIEMADGTGRELDVLIYATGFKMFEPGGQPTFEVRGRDGVRVDEWWGENRYQAFEGVSLPRFPNLFSIVGPYGYNGSSYFNLIENQLRHITRCLVEARERDATSVEVTEEANREYFEQMLGRRGNQVFWQDSCAQANSYYFDPNGDVPLRPSPTIEHWWRSGHFDLAAYEFGRGSAEPSETGEAMATEAG